MYFIGLVDGSREGGNFSMSRLLLDIGLLSLVTSLPP